eukprot:COSAG06_NODE_395_length_16293_cov_43.719835_5_plen_92_part_00
MDCRKCCTCRLLCTLESIPASAHTRGRFSPGILSDGGEAGEAAAAAVLLRREFRRSVSRQCLALPRELPGAGKHGDVGSIPRGNTSQASGV